MGDHLNEREVQVARERVSRLKQTLYQVLFGQELLIDQVLVAMIAGGHVLLEGLPGLGKTELVKALGKALELEVKRIQFTPDLLPGDVTGNPLLTEQGGTRALVFQRGPVFTNILLADEINRASPKTQSALLEAMQERKVTVMGETHVLPSPFLVLATQNPIELEGTYPLPEAQLDRFLFKVEIKQGNVAVLEQIVLRREMGVEPQVPQTLSRAELMETMQAARRVYMPEVVANYIARLVAGSHAVTIKGRERVRFGASPRAALGLAVAAKARALSEGRVNASFEDVSAVAQPVLGHRIILDYGARLDGITSGDVVAKLVESIAPNGRELPNTVAIEAR